MISADRPPGFGIKEDHDPLMRLKSLGWVSLDYAEKLGPEDGLRAHRARHDPKEPSLGERDDRAQSLFGFAAREGDHRVANERDADLIGEPVGDFVAINESHAGESRFAVTSCLPRPLRQSR